MKMTVNPRPCVHTIADLPLPYLYYEGTGPPLLLLHATGFHPWLWHPVARRLAPRYTIIAPYICDHRTVDPAEGLQWNLLAEDLFRLCHELGCDRPFIVGHSMGASVATLAHALHGLNASAMVLIEPIFLPARLYDAPHTLEAIPLAEKALKRRNHWADRAEARAYLKGKPLFARWDEEVLDLYLQHGMVADGQGGLQLACAPAREAALFSGDRRHNPWPDLSKVTCPVLVLEGERSEYANFIDLPRAASLFPFGRYRLVPDAGHLIPMEQPEAVTRLIQEFFSDLPPMEDQRRPLADVTCRPERAVDGKYVGG